MKRSGFFLAIPVTLCMLGVYCGKGKDSNPVNTPPTTNYRYLAAGNHGDIIRYTLRSDHTYSYVNETTHDSGSGAYSMSTNPNLSGVYEITAAGNTYYVVELPGKIMLTSNPSGNGLNKLVVGLTADMDLSTDYTPAQLAGDYLYLGFQDNAISCWGGYRINSQGTYTWGVVPDTMDPEKDASFNFMNYINAGADHGGGNWTINSANHSRINFQETVASGLPVCVGTIYPGKAMLIDQGPTYGLCLGLRYPSSPLTQADVAGSYRYLDVTGDGQTGVGYFQLPANGTTMPYYFKYNGAAGQGTGSGIRYRAVSHVNNMFAVDDTSYGALSTTYLLVLSEGVMMHFCYTITGTSWELASCGVSGKIN
jgi:hypothetical protein